MSSSLFIVAVVAGVAAVAHGRRVADAADVDQPTVEVKELTYLPDEGAHVTEPI
jgi:hypothetical protein